MLIKRTIVVVLLFACNCFAMKDDDQYSFRFKEPEYRPPIVKQHTAAPSVSLSFGRRQRSIFDNPRCQINVHAGSLPRLVRGPSLQHSSTGVFPVSVQHGHSSSSSRGHFVFQPTARANSIGLFRSARQEQIDSFTKIVGKHIKTKDFFQTHPTLQTAKKLDHMSAVMAKKSPTAITKKRHAMARKSKPQLLRERKEIYNKIYHAENKLIAEKDRLSKYLESHGVTCKNRHDSVYEFIKKSAKKEVNWQHLLKHNFAFIKPKMMPKLVELSESIYKAELTLADLRLSEKILESTIKQQETLDFVITTPTTSTPACELMEKHEIDFPSHLLKKYPELDEKINTFAETNAQLDKAVCGLTFKQNDSLGKQWRASVHSVFNVVERVAVKTIQTIFLMVQHDGWEEARGHAESIGKLAEFEQHMKELIEEQNKYIAAGIKGPLNSLERWVSNPVKETGNSVVGVGNLGYQLTYKLAELETAADLASNGKIPEAEKIYGRINSEIDTIYKHISAMSGPEILKAITEMGTDGFMLGTVFKVGTYLLRNARLSNISTDECLTQICKEVGCEVPKNAKNMLELITKEKSILLNCKATKDSVLERLKSLLDSGKKIDNRIENMIAKDTKILFRKDFGKNAHELTQKRGYPKDVKFDHYNIDIQTRRYPCTNIDKWDINEKWHIVTDSKGNATDFY